MTKMRILGASALCALAVAGCTNPDGTPNRTGTGALTGALAGAALGKVVGDDTKSTVIGGVVGAAAGAAVGNQLDKQAAELQQTLSGSGAGVVNTGDQLIVSLPEAITFPVDSTELKPAIRGDIISVSQSLQQYPNTSVQVIGHTDNTGSAEYNQGLSERRAQVVSNTLIAGGTSPGRIASYGVGLTRPIASNDTAEGRAANRRVEIVITPTG